MGRTSVCNDNVEGKPALEILGIIDKAIWQISVKARVEISPSWILMIKMHREWNFFSNNERNSKFTEGYISNSDARGNTIVNCWQ